MSLPAAVLRAPRRLSWRRCRRPVLHDDRAARSTPKGRRMNVKLVVFILATSLTAMIFALHRADAQDRDARDTDSSSPRDPRPERDKPGQPARKKGLILNTDAAFAGYTLFAPLQSTTTYLVDMK